MGEIDDTKKEFQITGRTFHEPQFATETRRARFHTVPIPPLRGGGDRLRLMTVRSEGQFNTVVYEEEDVYRGASRRDVVFMAPEDVAAQGLAADDRVVVATEAGSLEVSVVPAPIRAGNLAMFYPEANVLVPRRLGARSRTPAFKSVLARIEVAGASRGESRPERQGRA